MDKLPPEILRKVFINLESPQRHTCLTVCRSWWSLLYGGSLYYDICLEENYQAHFNRMVDMFEKSPDLAVQVEKLTIQLEYDTHFNSKRLLNMFPNARIMRLSQSLIWTDSEPHCSTQHFDNTHLKSRIEFLSDYQPFNLVSQINYSNLGGRLKELDLDLSATVDFSYLVSLLKDLPVLKTLALNHPQISIADLEEMHNSIPSLENFRLNYLVVEPGHMPVDIVPAACIKKLKFVLNHIRDPRDHIQIYRYATQKYTNITDIEYDDYSLDKNYANDTKELYLNGLLDFYKLIAPRTTNLTIRRLPEGVDIFEALDGVGSQIKNLKFRDCGGGPIFPYLSQSCQSKHVEELDFWESAIDSIDLIKSMTNLTSLTIGSFRGTIHLANCLDACPSSLKSLKISCDNLVIEPFNNTLDSIETLVIRCFRLSDNIGDIISSCFPNLVELELDFNLDENISISLKNRHFRKAVFYINKDYKWHEYGLSFKSPHYPEDQHYLGNSVKEKTCVQYQYLEDLPILSVEFLIETRLEIGDDSIKVLRC